jgi:HEAT repeat protein
MRKLLGAAVLWLCAAPVWSAETADLVKQLKSANPDERRAAAEALGKAGKDAKDAGPALIVALKDNDTFVRTFAAQALGEIGAEPKIAVPALALVLRSNKEKEEVLEAAAGALGAMGATAVKPLSDAAKATDLEPRVRRKAISSLGQIGTDAKAAVPVLTDVVKGMYAPSAQKGKKTPAAKIEDLRPDAATALGEIAAAKDSAALAALEDLVGGKKNKKDKNLKKTISDAIAKIKARS